MKAGEILHLTAGVDAAGAEMEAPAQHVDALAFIQHGLESLAHAGVQCLGAMRIVVEQEAEIERAQFGYGSGPDRRTGDHHIDRADDDLLHHVSFLAELAIGEEVEADALARLGLQRLLEQVEPDVMRSIGIDRHRG